MSDKSKIEWTDATWWASSRLPGKATAPLRWCKPRRALVRYWSEGGDGDLFADGVTDEEIDRVFAVMALAQRHTFQILTKRPERMRAYLSHTRAEGNVPSRIIRAAQATAKPERAMLRGDFAHDMGWPLRNVWAGVSVEDQATADERVPLLLQTPAAVRFVSYEPAIGPVDFQMLRGGEMLDREGAPFLDALRGSTYWPNGDHGANIPGLDGIIVGGESGPGARPCDVAWIRSTVAQCKLAEVACFVKQVGSEPYRGGPARDDDVMHALRDRKGADPSEWPEDLRVRQLPGKVTR